MENFFTVSSNLSIPAGRSSVVDCLVSVSALKAPLKSSINLTVELSQFEESQRSSYQSQPNGYSEHG
ncbi:hypothetical protein AMECASPLE_032083 [Ameca splendens]|uniref:Uncharacterized protein n=1 Tax=Ameca splendens TaxID=208324 RepID=A0ABV0ZHA5_9TELE